MSGIVSAPDQLRGVLILDADGEPVAAYGIAELPDLASRMAAAWQDARRQQRRLFSVASPDAAPMVVVVLTMADMTLLVAMQRDGRDPLFELVSSVDAAGDILAHFLTNPYEALAFADRQGVLRYMSPVHERFFGVAPGSAVGRHSTEVIENSRLQEVAHSGKAEIGTLQEVRGVTRVVSRHPIRNRENEIVGSIGQMMFTGPDRLQALAGELTKLKSEVAYYRRELDDLKNRGYGLHQMVGESVAMQRLRQQIVKVAPLDIPVLLTGESGTGKELAAHAIHKLSARRDAAMVVVNAAALPSTLVESELFGYEAGSFTGAERKGRIGKIEQSDGGSLFFDEAGDIPADVQVKLLRVLQDGTFQRVGGHKTQHSNFRLISASNRDFGAMIEAGTFRLDLYYRIGAVTIRLPSLRERLEDIPLLAQLALDQFAQRHGQRAKTLSAAALAFLAQQPWPGNVRQLMHSVERAAIFAERDVVEPADFSEMDGSSGSAGAGASTPEVFTAIDRHKEQHQEPHNGNVQPKDLSSAIAQVERQFIRDAMTRLGGNKKRVAEELGISRPYLYKRLAQMGLATDE